MKDVIANILHTQPNLTGREIAKIPSLIKIKNIFSKMKILDGQ